MCPKSTTFKSGPIPFNVENNRVNNNIENMHLQRDVLGSGSRSTSVEEHIRMHIP